MNFKCCVILSASFILLNIVMGFSQPSLKWDKTYGGLGSDLSYGLTQLPNGTLVSGGPSYSSISGDRTVPSYSFTDYWIVQFDTNGTKLSDYAFGGSGTDELQTIITLSDGNLLLAGWSDSKISGTKSENSYGKHDFWIVKTTPSGNVIWDKTLGGSEYDLLFDVKEMEDGSIIAAGSSESDSNAIKSENSKGGYDYWVIKLDSSGNKLWDKTIGGSGGEKLREVAVLANGEIILGGSSNSNATGDKSHNRVGLYDYWVVKLDINGNKLWDKTIGGTGTDDLYALKVFENGDIIVGGESNSGASGDKSENSNGQKDFWLLKLDANGNKLWDVTLGGNKNDLFREIYILRDQDLIIGGCSVSDISGDKSDSSVNNSYDYWVLRIDSIGNKLWDKTIGGNGNDEVQGMVVLSNKNIILGGFSNSGISGQKTENSKGSYDMWMICLEEQPNDLIDTIAPVPDLTQLPTMQGECTISITNIPTATDNTVGQVQGVTSDSLSYSQVGIYTITWTYSDTSGNSVTQQQIVEIIDTSSPVPDSAILPIITAECSLDLILSNFPTAMDNCAGPITATTTDTLTYNEVGTYTINWLYDDGHGNTTSQQQTIEIIDTTSPVADSAQLKHIIMECNVSISYIPTATDACQGVIMGTTTDSLYYDELGTYTINWSYDDGYGNVSTQQQMVTIIGIPEDFNDDGIVSNADFLLFIAEFNKTCVACRMDLNNDSAINNKDFLIFLSNFGKDCSSMRNDF